MTLSYRGLQPRTNPRELTSPQECALELPHPQELGVLSETFYHHVVKAAHSSHMGTIKRGFLGEFYPRKDPDLSSHLHTEVAGHLKIAGLLIKYLKNTSILPGN